MHDPEIKRFMRLMKKNMIKQGEENVKDSNEDIAMSNGVSSIMQSLNSIDIDISDDDEDEVESMPDMTSS